MPLSIVRKGDSYPYVASYGLPREFDDYMREHPIVPGRGSVVGRVVTERRAIHVHDVELDPDYKMADAVRLSSGGRTMLGVPLMREGTPIGVLVLGRRKKVDPFTDKQIELVTTFADQAVIAIENARLFEEEQQRTRELTECLEQQTATSQVLQVISGSPGDLQPVFATMLENAVRICDAKFGNIYRRDGDKLHLVAAHNTPSAFVEHRNRSPLPPNPRDPVGRMLRTKAVVHVADLAAEATYIEDREAAVELGGMRSGLVVPLMNESEVIGAFVLARQEVRPFSDKQIALVENFAAQAVIAIENARLLNELRQRRRSYRSARSADRDVGSAARHLQLAGRSQAGFCGDVRECRTHLRQQIWEYLPLGWRGVSPSCRAQQPTCHRRASQADT